MAYSLVDLFAGTGAFSYAFHKTNQVETVYANDLLQSSKEIYDINNHISLDQNDLNDVDETMIPPINILSSGFPCQPFSLAGLKQGFKDPRSNVFWKIISIIQYHKPDVVILENVKNLKSHDNGNTFKTIIDSLHEQNYYVKYSILSTSKITGIPHGRERIYIVCFKEKWYYDHFNFDFEGVELKNVREFLEKNVDKKYYYTNKSAIYDKIKNHIINDINKTNTVYQYRRHYVRENKNNVCPTLTANMGTGGHNVPLIRDSKGIRKLTPRECFNLQGFPETYKLPNISDAKLYSLAGNAVSVPIIELLANKIINLFNHQ